MRKGFTGALAAVFISAALFMGGCGCMPEKTAPAQEPKELYGIVDMETLVKAHPAYSEYFRLETEYKGLLAGYQEEQKRLMHLSALERRAKDGVMGEAAQKAAEAEYKTRVKLKEDELNRGLEALYKEIRERHAGEPGTTEISGAEDTATRIANLQLRLKVLGISGAERTAAEAELGELLNGRKAHHEAAAFTEEEKQALSEKKAAAEKELAAFAEKTAKEIREKQLAKEQMILMRQMPDAALWNKDWEDKLKKKQNEMAAVKAGIMKDIREKAALIGQEKQLAMIFSSYRANIDAVDVTGEMVSELVQIKLPAKTREAGK